MVVLIVNEHFLVSRDQEILLDDLSDDLQVHDREGLPGNAKIGKDEDSGSAGVRNSGGR